MTTPANYSPTSPARTDRRIVLNTGALATSSLWRIGVSFALQLVIARLLGAQGLGQYATALAWVNVCQILSELGLPQLLVRDLARYPKRRLRGFQTALFVQISAALLVWVGVFGLTAILPYQPDTRLALLLITASLPLFAVTSVCQTLFQASERMELVMGVEVVINTLIVAASLLVLWQGGGVAALCTVIIATQTVSASVCLWLLRHSQLIAGPQERMTQGIWVSLQHLWRQTRPFYGLALANVLLHRLDILLLSIFAGDVVTGIYSAAYLIVRVLIILVQTWWQALYPTFSRLRIQAEEQYRRLAALSIRFGLLAFLPVAGLSRGAADWLLGVVYRGEDHSEALAAYGVLIWAAPLFLVATYAVNLLLVERQPKGSLLIAATHIGVALSLLPFLTRPLASLRRGIGDDCSDHRQCRYRAAVVEADEGPGRAATPFAVIAGRDSSGGSGAGRDRSASATGWPLATIRIRCSAGLFGADLARAGGLRIGFRALSQSTASLKMFGAGDGFPLQ